jgi:hypothetical protein
LRNSERGQHKSQVASDVKLLGRKQIQFPKHRVF